MTPKSRVPHWVDLLLIAVFLLSLSAVAWGIVQWRGRALAQIDTPENEASWNEWREESERLELQPEYSQRRAAKSPVQPGVVLLSEHFTAVLLGILATIAVPIGVLLWILRELIAGRSQRQLSTSASEPD